jgi:four helix bundle protein
MGAKRFEELRAWQLAAELRDRIVAITATPPFKADQKFCDQLRGAACAAPRLIAEGFGRFSRREFRHYVNMARAELMEVLNDLTDLDQRGWCSREDVEALRDLADHAIRVTTRLHSSLS